jgi:HIV Tat-specific factor 1
MDLSRRKLDEWDDEDNFGPSVDPSEEGSAPNKSRVVVLKHMFTLQELEEDAALLLDLKDDVREECSSLGEVTNVVLYDVRMSARLPFRDLVSTSTPIQKEPDGVMTVKFREPIGAQACVVVCISLFRFPFSRN